MGQRLLQDLLGRPHLAWVHWTPPCGAFSRAREIRRPGAPPPLRNHTYIRGFPALQWKHKARVHSANLLTDFMAACCRQLSARGICWSIENPTNSLLWHYPSVRTLITDKPETQFHACMWGSRRRKATSIVSNRSWFHGLARFCDGQHTHLGWGKVAQAGTAVWSTALESAYPKALATQWAQCAASSRRRAASSAAACKRRRLRSRAASVRASARSRGDWYASARMAAVSQGSRACKTVAG